MKASDMLLLYEFNAWATGRVMDAAAKATPEQLTTQNDFGWGSLHGALFHILGAEYGWRRFLAAESDADALTADDCPDLASLRERWTQETGKLHGWLATLSDADMDREVVSQRGGQSYRWRLWQCLLHVVNHGTQHRSECAALLTGYGHSPGDLDLTLFLHERGLTAEAT